MVCERRRVLIEIDEEETVPGLQPYRDQPVILGAEIGRLLHAERRNQPAVEIVDPGVVGAGDRAAGAASGEKPRAAMPAGVGEGAQGPRAVAQQDHRLPDDLEDEIVAGLCDLVRAADEVPGLEKDALDLALVEFRRGVAVRREPLGLESRFPHTLVKSGIEHVASFS